MQYSFDEVIDRKNTNCYKWDYQKEYFGQDNLIPMWVADMDFKAPPFVIEAIRSRLEHGILGYTFRPDSFYEAIADWMKRKHGWDVKKEWICFSPGIVPALNMAVMTYTKPGDKIIVQTPVYYPFFSAVKNHNRILTENPLKLVNSRYTIDFDDLKKKIDSSTKMLILCSPHNPTGNVWRKEELLQLANICLENNILILSDEIHADLVYPDFKHIPTASLSGEIADQTVTCVAPSKTFNLAGLSTSAIIASNKKLYKKFYDLLDHVHVGEGNIFGFVALEAAFKYGDAWLKELLIYLQENIDFLVSFLKDNIPRVVPIIPEATYLVWLDFRRLNLKGKKLHQFLIEKAGIGLSHGNIFGQNGEGFQRINVGCPRKTLEQALNQLKDAIKNNY